MHRIKTLMIILLGAVLWMAAPAAVSAAESSPAPTAPAEETPAPSPSESPSASPSASPSTTPTQKPSPTPTPELEKLPQVTGLRMGKGTASSMEVLWDAVPKAEYYEVYVSETFDGAYTLLGETDKTTYTVKDMKRGRLLYVKVRAMSEDQMGTDSELLAIAPVPDKVTGIRSIKNVKTKITLQWNETAGATGYIVYYRPSTSTKYLQGGMTEDTSFQITGLNAAKEYYFIVYAYAADIENVGAVSDEVMYGTAPALPKLKKVKGGDRRVKVYWSKGTGAQLFRIYVSTDASSGYVLGAVAGTDEYMIRAVDGLLQNKKYYVKVAAVRVVCGIEMESESEVLSATTKKASATSTKAKKYTTKAKFKKSAAYKKYKDFRKQVVYGKCFVLPGMRNTNVAGFNAARMVPQSITFAGNYLLMSAYDYTKAQESVIYILNKNTRKYITTLVLPHTGHVGGITFDGTNIWITYGKKVQSFRYSLITSAAVSGKPYVETFSLLNTCQLSDTVSYLAYYKGKLWAGAYNEKLKKYMYGYTILNKTGVPTLKMTNRMLMPNRTQGVAFTSGGKMLVSRSCQTKKGRSGFLSRLDTYKPTWNLGKKSIKKNKRKKSVPLPPMNEGIAISGSYTYIIYESPAFSECEAPVDRITAFKTKKIS